MRSARAMSALLLIIIPHLAASQKINLMPNPGFEIKSVESWAALGSCSYEIYSNAKRSGKNSLAFHPTSEGAGVRCDISAAAQPGYSYAFTGFFRTVSAGWGEADVLLHFKKNGKAEQILIGRADTNEKGWTELSRPLVIPGDADPYSLELIIKTSWDEIAFLADDLELRPALQVKIQQNTPPEMPEMICQLGPADAERKSLDIHAQIYDSQNNLMHQFNTILDTPTRQTLSPGLYRIHAIVSDVDGRPFVTDKPYYVGNAQELIRDLQEKANAILASQTLQRYHGWIRYLTFLCCWHQERDGLDSDLSLQSLLRLDDWTKKIANNSNVFDTFSGVIEWAYESPVDESGQPFRIAIPTMYTTVKSYPMVVVMHGYGGNHMEHSNPLQSNPDYFELHVLGRARGGRYVDLSEADVLDAVNYVMQYWNIDESRIHLTGSSMGGAGTFQLAVRHPHRWASGRPVCGYGSTLPTANMLHVPMYATHSQDDPTVPVLASRATLRKLSGLGGQVIIDETTGLQHAAWNYAEGYYRSHAWAMNQVRPGPRNVCTIDYTAMDRRACRAYWMKVAEWGDMPGFARFKAVAANENQLYLQLENIRTLQIMIPESPFNPEKNLQISVDGGLGFLMSAPLPDSVFVSFDNGQWSALPEMPNRPPFILHTAGGSQNLYSSEPILIVWGTGGNEEARKNLAQAGELAAKSINVMWLGDDEEGRDGVPNNRILYGRLNSKPDTAVTDADLNKYHLLLFGSAEENAVIRNMQAQLPVQQNDKQIVCSDGITIEKDHTIMGLYFYNPLAPGRLIYWVAADKPEGYQTGFTLFQNGTENQCATDFLVIRDDTPTTVTVRHFNSRWSWSGAFEKTALIPQQDLSYTQLYKKTAEAMRSVSGSDFAIYGMSFEPRLHAGVAETTRWADVAALDMTTPIAVFQMKGSLLLDHHDGFTQGRSRLRFYPDPDDAQIDPNRVYQVAMSSAYLRIRELINQQSHVPDTFVITDYTIFEAMRRSLF